MDSQYHYRKYTQGRHSTSPTTSPPTTRTKSQEEDKLVNIALDDTTEATGTGAGVGNKVVRGETNSPVSNFVSVDNSSVATSPKEHNLKQQEQPHLQAHEKAQLLPETSTHHTEKNLSSTPSAPRTPDINQTTSPSANTGGFVPSTTTSFASQDMAIIEEKARRLLREGHINEEEYALIINNHCKAMDRTTIPPPQPRSLPSTSPPQNNAHLTRLSRRRYEAEQQAMSSLTKAEAKKQKQSKIRHQQITINLENWRNKILPRWEEYKSTSVVARLVQQGIPTSLRGRIWCLMLHNKLKITPDMYQEHLEEAMRMYDSNGRLSLAPLEVDESEPDANNDEDVEAKKDENEYSFDNGDTRNNVDDVDFQKERQRQRDGTEDGWQSIDKDILSVKGIGSDTDTNSEQEHEEKDMLPLEGGSGLSASSVICQLMTSHNDSLTTADSFNDNSTNIKSSDSNSFQKSSPPHVRNSVSGSTEKLDLLIASMTLIQRDIPRTFPTLSFFHDDGPLASSLDHVLKAYACYEPNIGYVQGMSYIAALLLLYMDEYETFVCLSNLLAIRTNRDFYLLQRPAITGYVNTFNRFFKQYLPLLAAHFEDEGIGSEIFLLDWHLTIFAKALPLEIAARIWDCYLHCGEVYILRASLGLLRMFARRLASLGMEKILPFLAHIPEDELTAQDLISSIEHIKISAEKYRSVRLQFDGSLQRDSVSMGAIAPEEKSPPNSFSFRKSIASIFY